MEIDKDNKEFFESLSKISEDWNKIVKEIEDSQEQYWNSLSKDEQLKVFCAVSRRICKGELELQGSYRYVLYDVFGFGPESYSQAQDAGYLALHNAIYNRNQQTVLLNKFCKHIGLNQEQTNAYVDSFLKK